MFAFRSSRHRTVLAGTALVVSAVLVGQIAAGADGGGATGAIGDSDPDRRSAPDVPAPVSVDGKPLTLKGVKVHPIQVAEEAKINWPDTGRASGKVPSTKGAFVTLGDSGFAVGAPDSNAAKQTGAKLADDAAAPDGVVIEPASQEVSKDLDLPGVVARVSTDGRDMPGPVALRLDYTTFAQAYGGDWASRLQFVVLPDCALTTPELAQCRTGTAVPSHNDPKTGTVTAVIDLAADAAPTDPATESPAPVVTPNPTPTATPAPSATPTAPAMTTASVRASRDLTNSGGTVVAVTAATAGVGGDWGATPLSESSTWSAGGSSGSASWSYPIGVPDVPGSLVPDLAIGYNSGSVDGRTAGRNNQSSWIGEGFDLAPGFIERRYVTCADDTAADQDLTGTFGQGANNTVHKTGDLCWRTDNAVLSFGGSVEELVLRDDGTWRKRFDDGTRIERKTDTSSPTNGAANGEYWKITTPDGTEFYFGRGDVNGYQTNSAWTVPVYGNHPGEPGHASAFKDSGVNNTAWRWNLDKVVDVHDNAVVYTWTEETNRYTPATDTTATSLEYTRGGTLARIDYGFKANELPDRVVDDVLIPGVNSARVEFTVAERCTEGVSECAPGEITAHAGRWPDVPFDQICNSTSCDDKFTPTFFSRKRLTTITTGVRGASGWTDVNRWAIDHDIIVRDPADMSSKSLWPTKITQTAKYGDDITLPAVRLFPLWLQNRVDSGTDNAAAIYRPRLAEVINGSAGLTRFDYAAPECTPSNLPAARDDNQKRCFPVRYAPPGSNDPPTWHWFHKYVVAKVTRQDLATSGEPTITEYTYENNPAWAYDDSVLSKKKDRTWNQWRGYEQVITTTGSGFEPDQGGAATKLKTVSSYYRGLYGTKDNEGDDPDDDPDAVVGDDPDDLGSNTRSDHVPSRLVSGETAGTGSDSTVKDYARFAGMTRMTITYDGATEVSVAVTVPWQSAATAVARAADGGSVARLAGVGTTHTFTKLTQLAGTGEANVGTWRHTQVRNTERDSDGYITETIDDGEVGLGGDTICTRTTYNDRTGARIIDRVASVTTRSGDCTSGELISQSKNYYDTDTDASEHGEAVDRGLVTRVSAIKGTAASPTWSTVSTTVYDGWGRPTEIVQDPDGLARTTKTAYHHTGQGRLDRITETAPDPDGTGGIAIVTTTEIDPVLGVPTSQESPSGAEATVAYDALGRLTAMWSDGRAGASVPDVAHSYDIRDVSLVSGVWKATGPNAVTTTTRLNDGENEQTKADGTKTKDRIVRSIALYDGLLRPRQTQTELLADDQYPSGGRLITLTEYDSRGLVVAQHGPAFNNAAVGPATADFLKFTVGDPAPGTTRAVFDGAGRPTTSTLTAFTPADEEHPTGQLLTLPTSYTYGGYWTKVTPPGALSPAGQPVTEPVKTTVIDARGQTTRLIENGGTTAKTRLTTYTWTPAGQPDTMTDGAGNSWDWTWDLRGNRTGVVDPDAGTTSTVYDDLGQATTSFTETIGDKKWALITTYDALGRRTKLEQAEVNGGAIDNGTKITLSSWTYDTLKYGLPTSATQVLRNSTGQTANLVTAVTGYGTGDRPTGSTTTVPTLTGVIEAELAGTYATALSYNSDGSIKTAQLGSYGPIKGERLRHGYDSNGRPEYLTGSGSYVADVLRAPTGEGLRYGMGNTWSKAIWLRQAFQPGTRRLTDMWIDRESVPTTDVHTQWTYDLAGNPTKVGTWRALLTDTVETSASAEETECFAYDGLRQLTAAWTPDTGTCVAGGADGTLGGPAPYSQQWTFDTRNANRLTETTRTGGGTSGLPVKTTSATYSYLDSGDSHQLQSVSTVVNGTGSALVDTYTFDEAGNTKARIVTSSSPVAQTLTWNPEGKITKIADGVAVVEENFYDTDGSRVVRRDPTSTTLYLGDTEITRHRTTGALSWKRYYDFDRRTIAMRDGNAMSDVQFQITDPHNTGTWAAEAGGTDTDPLMARRTTPYGDLRGTTTTGWASLRGFVGGTLNPGTGLTHIGARQYEPGTGRFVSPDPLLDVANPLQHHAYGYGNNNPLFWSDPTGLVSENGLSVEAGINPYTGERLSNYYAVNGWSDARHSAETPVKKLEPAAPPPGQQGEKRSVLERISSALSPLVPGYGGKIENYDPERRRLERAQQEPLSFPEFLIGMMGGGPLGGARKSGAGAAGAAGAAAGSGIRTAAAGVFTRTEALSGNASSRLVKEIAESMRTNGWQGPPIKVVELSGQRIVVDGHHRLAAAQRVGIDVRYEVVDPKTVIGSGQWSSVDDVLNDAATVGPNRLR